MFAYKHTETIECVKLNILLIYTPTFSSSDWSPHVFIIGHVPNVMQYASEIYASVDKTEAKSWDHKLIK